MLVEKDYWIMHALWGLQALGFVFELKSMAVLVFKMLLFESDHCVPLHQQTYSA